MPKKSTKLNFRMSTEEMVHMAKRICSFMNRDEEEFYQYGVNAETKAAFKEKTALLESYPTDLEMLGGVAVATQERETAAAELRLILRGIMTRVANKYGEDSARYRMFGAKGLIKMGVPALLRCVSTVHRRADAHFDDLATEGLARDHLTELLAARARFEALADLQEDAETDRELATEDRIALANELYALLVKYCNTGKDIWATKSEARYNDYIIYTTTTTRVAAEVTE